MLISPDAATLMHAAAEQLLTLSRAAIEARGIFHIALSGGSTPNVLFRLMASAEYAAQFDWAHIHLWWSDERCVPLESPELNFNMANDALIRHVPIRRPTCTARPWSARLSRRPRPTKQKSSVA